MRGRAVVLHVGARGLGPRVGASWIGLSRKAPGSIIKPVLCWRMLQMPDWKPPNVSSPKAVKAGFFPTFQGLTGFLAPRKCTDANCNHWASLHEDNAALISRQTGPLLCPFQTHLPFTARKGAGHAQLAGKALERGQAIVCESLKGCPVIAS